MSAYLKREDCTHRVLRFGSGDYYIFCHDCDARWVASQIGTDKAAPELANKGKGCALSGQVRITVP